MLGLKCRGEASTCFYVGSNESLKNEQIGQISPNKAFSVLSQSKYVFPLPKKRLWREAHCFESLFV